MRLENIQRDADGYLVNADTGRRVVFYECDPLKNCLCDKTMCRSAAGTEDEGEFGFCASTPEPQFRKDGGKAFYKRWNGEYYGREYINEEAVPHDES